MHRENVPLRDQSGDGRRIINRNGRIVLSAPVDDGASAWLLAGAQWAQGFARRAGGLVGSRLVSGSFVALPLMVTATGARAQVITPLVQPTIEADYRRGRNVAVDEQSDPSFQALGWRFGSVVAFPSVGVVTGATSNVYANNNFKRSDAFYYIQPALRVTTDLPRHEVNLIASANLQRFAHETIRNQNSYFTSLDGRLDIGPNITIEPRVQYSRTAETPFNADINADISVLSSYTTFNPSIVAMYSAGRTRVRAKVDRLALEFNRITFGDGSFRDQRFRDRTADRASFQFEYALSPSIATFAQANVDLTDYSAPLPDGSRNRDSKAYTALGGVNFDLAGLMRGSVAAGYTTRNYDAPAFQDKAGLAVQVQTEFFLSPLTTVGLGVQRTLQDSSSTTNGAYVETRAAASVDHALLRNLILSAAVTNVHQKLVDTSASSTRMLSSLSARYQSNRFVTLGASVSYGRARQGAISFGIPFDEFSGQVSLRFRR